MKINEVEAQLGITKANLRFYEKQGLLSPQRSENGYRDYSEADIARLKDIIILRKLNIPVQQIEDILDGALPLQEAMEDNISNLQKEIQRLSGSLALCRQLKEENSAALDTQRYWQLIQEKEKQGFQFQSLARDYLTFVTPVFEVLYWFPLGEALECPKKIPKYLTYSLLYFFLCAALGMIGTKSRFWSEFFRVAGSRSLGILLVVSILIPIYLYSKKNAQRAKSIRDWVPIVLYVLTFVLTVVVLTVFVASLA